MRKRHLRICKLCGKDLASTRTNSAKFCKACYKKREKERIKKYKQKYYQKNKQKLKQKRDEKT